MNVVLPKSREMKVRKKGPIHNFVESGRLLSVLNEHKVRKGGPAKFLEFPSKKKGKQIQSKGKFMKNTLYCKS